MPRTPTPTATCSHLGGPGWLDLFQHRAADRTIVQVEQVISNEEIRSDPWATTIAAADAIVRAPFGAHPFYSRGFYITDGPHLRAYIHAAEKAAGGDRAALEEYLDRHCRQPARPGGLSRDDRHQAAARVARILIANSDQEPLCGARRSASVAEEKKYSGKLIALFAFLPWLVYVFAAGGNHWGSRLPAARSRA